MSDQAPEIDNGLWVMDCVGFASQEKADELVKKRDEALRLVRQLESGERMPKHLKPIHKRLQAYSRATSLLMEYVIHLNSVNRHLNQEYLQATEDATERARKRWTEQEDEILVSKAAEGAGVQNIALALRRTPGAVSARISHLVGVRRISESFAGGIEGYLNGEEIKGTFVGELKRGTSGAGGPA